MADWNVKVGVILLVRADTQAAAEEAARDAVAALVEPAGLAAYGEFVDSFEAEPVEEPDPIV